MKRCSKFILILILILSVLNLKITNSVKADSYNSESIFPVSINMESLSINDTNEGKTLNSDNAFLSFISSPLVNTILLILAFTSLVVELFVPGFGVFGFLSLFSFILFFIGGINTGSVDIISMSMFALGLVLLFIELLIPGFGVAGVTGIFSLIAGLILSSQNISHGIVSVSIAIFISIIVSYILIKKGMKSKLFGKVILNESLEVKDKKAEDFTNLYNKIGKTVTILRPSGIIEIDGKRYDALTEGEFIESNVEIIVSRIVGSKIFVRRVKCQII